MKSVDIILLAAGASKRFGSQKLLADFYGKPLYQYAFEAVAQVEFCRVLVVTNLADIQAAAKGFGFIPVESPLSYQGISASIHAGVHASREDAVLSFFVCDQPGFSGTDYRKFLLEFLDSGCPLGRVCCDGRPGSPTVFSPSFRRELLSLTGDEGGKSIFANRKEETFFYPVSAKSLVDYDTPWKSVSE